MKVIVNGLDLSNAVLKVSKAISAKTTNPVLTGIKLSVKGDELCLSATDMEISIEKTIKCETFMEGETVVPGKLFTDFINKLETEDQVELNLSENNQLKIVYSSSEGFIQTMNPEEFPSIRKDLTKNNFKLLQKDFKDLINKTVFACSTDDSRPILKGCLFLIENKSVSAIALDGFRLAVCKKEIKESTSDLKAIVPARALLEITRLLEKDEDSVTVNVQDNNLMIEVDNTILTTRLLEGEYLNYKQIIPTAFTTETVIGKTDLLNSLERAAIVAKSTKNLVKFDIKENMLNVTANSETGNVNENVNINLKGKDLVIAFNSKYFTDCLKVIADETISISFNSAIAPCIITPVNGGEYLYLILPIRLNA